ncbi:MAG TPA: fibronectin type III domain-containing protein [Actinomycetota bacterium]|nr:fibronectin type III domain-containing protein [Actinomycetota bacterium]
MVRRALAAAVGVIAGLAPIAAPAAATSEPVTKIRLSLDAAQVQAWTNLTGTAVVTTGSGPASAPFADAVLTVSLDGVILGIVSTDDDGVAVLDYPMTTEGLHTLRVAFAGDAFHKKAQRDADVTVTPGDPPVVGVPEAPVIYIAEAPVPGLVYLEWTVPADGGSAITEYRVYRGLESGKETFLLSKGPMAFSADDTHATAGTTYFYVVTAVNANGESPWSNEVAVIAT